MPRVPVYNPQVRQELAAPVLRQDTTVSLQPIAAALNQATQVAQEAEKRSNQLAAEELLTTFQNDINTTFHDPDNGYFRTVGRDAYERSGDVKKSLTERLKALSSNVSPEIQLEFQRAGNAHLTRALADVDRHASGGLEAWEKATKQAAVETSIRSASNIWADTGRVEEYRQVGRKAVTEATQALGPEVTQLELEKYDSKLALNLIEAASGAGSSAMQDAYEQYGDKLSGSDRLTVQSELAKRREVESKQLRAAQVQATSTELVEGLYKLDNARSMILDEVNKIPDLELRKEVRAEAERQLKVRLQGLEDKRNADFQNLMLAREYESIEAIKSVPEFYNLTAAQRAAITKPAPIVTDRNLLTNLFLLPDDKLRNLDVGKYADKLATADYNRLLTAVKSSRQGGDDHQIARTRAAQVKSVTSRLYGKDSNLNDEDRQKVDAFHFALDNAVEVRENELQRKLTRNEFTEILKGLSSDYVVKDKFFGFIDSERDLTDLPPQEVERLTQILRDNGYPVTTANLLYLKDNEANGN